LEAIGIRIQALLLHCGIFCQVFYHNRWPQKFQSRAQWKGRLTLDALRIAKNSDDALFSLIWRQIIDTWIAAQTMEHGAELTTSDRHFEKISGLVCTIIDIE